MPVEVAAANELDLCAKLEATELSRIKLSLSEWSAKLPCLVCFAFFFCPRALYIVLLRICVTLRSL